MGTPLKGDAPQGTVLMAKVLEAPAKLAMLLPHPLHPPGCKLIATIKQLATC